jgi:hypothetical protein
MIINNINKNRVKWTRKIEAITLYCWKKLKELNKELTWEMQYCNIKRSSVLPIYEVSKEDWWRRWLYSTNAKDIGMLYIYFAIFSGIFIMPLINLVIYWDNLIKNYIGVVDVFNLLMNLIKSVNNFKICTIFISVNYLRDFKQELLLLNYLDNILIKILLWKFNLLFFRYYYNNKLFKLKFSNSQLGYYLAGLIESDGSIIIPKENSKNTPTISIIFHIDDKPLAECICNKLGYGSLETIELNKAVKLHIRGRYSIIDTIWLINGKLRTPKIEKLKELIGYINKNWNKDVKELLYLLPLDNSSLISNSWLAGFSDGDANFNISIIWPDNNKSKYGQIKLTFEIVQTRMDKILFNKYKPVMLKIASLCESKLDKHKVSKFDRSGKQDAWRARTVNKKGAYNIVKYFEQYPLFSSKYLNYCDWRCAYTILMINKEHIGINKLDTYNKIKSIKNKMNKSRINFNWNHLNNFYDR